MMRALVYKAAGKVAIESRPLPVLRAATDAIVKVNRTTICGTDLHLIKGDVPTCQPGRILGHEGIGHIHEVGNGVRSFKKGDPVLISCVSSCSTCDYCKKGMPSHCRDGGWILGNTIDGTQAEYVRIPHADSSLYTLPEGVDERALVMLSDIFPTGLECGVINGKVQPGSTVAVVGAGPVGLAAMITAKLYSPSTLIMIDTDKNRLETAKKFGATHVIDPRDVTVTEHINELTGGLMCDTVIEAVGIPATFISAQDIVGPGGTIANVGVHGTKVDLHLEKLWDRNISITTRLVDAITTPMLLKLVQSGKLDPSLMVTHDFDFNDMEEAYNTFGAAAKHGALKVNIKV